MSAIGTDISLARQRNTFSVGLMIALSSWALIFITLIWGYIAYRMKLASWFGDYVTLPIKTLAVINTLIMFCSSWSLSIAFKKAAKSWAWAAFSLGVFFLAGQSYLWQLLMASGLHWQKSIAGSFFFLLTGFHFIHIAGALPAVGILSARLDKMQKSMLGIGIKYFWDFLLVVWLVMFILIFIIQ